MQVQDNGCGMDPDQASRVFNPFYSTKGQGEGTGLGLSVSYGLIRRYGGSITVYLLSEPQMIKDEETLAEQLQAIDSNRNRISA